MILNDYRCLSCGVVTEFACYDGSDIICPGCGSHSLVLVFTEPPQMIVERASVVDHVISHNQKLMDGIYEEDASLVSD